MASVAASTEALERILAYSGLAAEGELLVGPLAALGQRTLHVHHGKVVGAEQVGDVAQEVGGIALLRPASGC